MTIDNRWVIYGAPVTTKSGVGFLNGFISLEYVLKKNEIPCTVPREILSISLQLRLCETGI